MGLNGPQEVTRILLDVSPAVAPLTPPSCCCPRAAGQGRVSFAGFNLVCLFLSGSGASRVPWSGPGSWLFPSSPLSPAQRQPGKPQCHPVSPCHPPPRCGSCMSPWHRLVGFHLKNRGRDVWGLKAPCLVWFMVEETRGGWQVCVSPCGVRADKWCLCPNTLWQEGTRWGVCSVLCHRGAGRRAQHLHAHRQGVFQGFSCRFRDAASWSGQVRGSYSRSW